MHTHSSTHHGETDHSGHHVSSMATLLGVFGALIVLTVVTVAVAYVDLGEFNLFVALGIATLKATLVALFFMHLAYDSGFNRLAFFGSIFFVLLFVGITLMDSGQYQATIEWNEKVLGEAAPTK
ncbi:MAG TPA: cytochrome C oxidase subunit IV family protein [Myxococcota bacterium]|nr:cytochrome C oxidase subunit IV family protein [Myxococcota bacterium]